MRVPIGPKILLTMLGVALPSLLLFSLLIFNSRGDILEENITRQLDGMATLSAQTVQDLVDNSKDALHAIASSPDVTEVIHQRESGNQEALNRALIRLERSFLDFQRLDRTIQAVRFIDAKGYVLAKVREEKIIPREGPLIPSLNMTAVSSKAERDFFQKAIGLSKGEVWVSNLERGWMEGEEYWCPAMVRFATPVFYSSGKPAGIVIINVWGEAVGTMTNRLIAPEEGEAFLVERNLNNPERHGIYLFHQDSSCEFGNQTGSRITALQDYPESITSSWMHENKGINYHPETRDLLVHHYFSPYGSDEQGWVIVVNAKRDFFMAPLVSLRTTLGLTIFLVLTLMVLTAIVFARTITKPIRAVIDGTHRISKDLGSRIEVDTKDEIATLAEEINEMAATLEQNMEEKRLVEEQICQSEKLASVGEMAAGLAHEINTPLSNIRALASLARKDINKDKIDPISILEDFRDIGEQTEKCSQIIAGLLGFARKQQSKFVLHNLNDLIEKALSLVRIKSDKKNIIIDFRRNEKLPHIKVDGHQIEQVCVNILLNALDAVEPKDRITVEADFSGAFVSLRFSDTGSGIDPEIIGKIFDPFFTTKGVGKGTGLGLSLSYGIVKNHGGTIQVESSRDTGTLFTVILPTGDRGGINGNNG
jgi:two-component system, NtrC family, sensor kinase